jgi:hypothetical protein
MSIFSLIFTHDSISITITLSVDLTYGYVQHQRTDSDTEKYHPIGRVEILAIMPVSTFIATAILCLTSDIRDMKNYH